MSTMQLFPNLSSSEAPTVSVQSMWLSSLAHRRNNLSQDEDTVAEMVLDDLPDEPPKEWHLHALSATDVGNQELQNGVGDGA